MAQALRRTVDQLRSQGEGQQVAGMTEGAAERIERLGGYLERTSGEEFLRDAEDFARRRPWMVAGIGLVVGLVSSMLGVAGGELLIPALVFIFGADIRLAGTASLAISLLIVAMGLWRYHRAGALLTTGSGPRIATSMSVGSLIGTALGGLAVAMAPTTMLKILLGLVLLAAAIKTVHRR